LQVLIGVGGQDVGVDERETIVLLHGFGATRRGWDPVVAELDQQRYRPLAHDLPGHGEASALRPVTVEACTEWVHTLSPSRFALAGYSMGGRIALQIALADPDRVSRLVLVSTTAGIEDDEARVARRDADDALAARLTHEPFEEFVQAWRAQPLFADDPPEVNEAAREDQRRNDPLGLAAALKGIGAGALAPVWDRLDELQMPATVLVGDRDDRYREIGARLARELPRGELCTARGGHTLLLENPQAVADALAGF
jgi:2-succinyl-6-hydroxy-2,4-cyclohexadiene-1-carboxylate synthase